MARMTAADAAVAIMQKEGDCRPPTSTATRRCWPRTSCSASATRGRTGTPARSMLVEVLLEPVTNISMGTELDNVVEFEELATRDEHAPTAVALLD